MTDRLGPVSMAEFSTVMHRLGPFEPNPRLAVGCSGGRDSMALLHLARNWAEAQAGKVTALIVDHNLRPGSAGEAKITAGWARELGASPAILTRRGPPPTANIQAKARVARYRLLSDWCHGAGIVHLLLAHHQDDQGETMLMRLARGSGVGGLAAMTALGELPRIRVLRPLLDIPRHRLRAPLQESGGRSLDDPSNQDRRFDRVRVRQFSKEYCAHGLTTEQMSTTAGQLNRIRTKIESDAARLIAAYVSVHPQGYAWIDPQLFREAPPDIIRSAISVLTSAIGGRRHPPRRLQIKRVCEILQRDELAGGRTISGCRLMPRKGRILVCRESGAISEITQVGEEFDWDGRFRFRAEFGTQNLRVAKLGRKGWAQIVKAQPGLRRNSLPAPVLPTLPAIWGLDGVVAVPHLCYICSADKGVAVDVKSVIFAPRRPIPATRFTTL